MNRTNPERRARSAASLLLVATIAFVDACAPAPATRPRRAAPPTGAPPPPAAQPTYRGPTPYRAPTPQAPTRDVTREPLRNSIRVDTPPAEASALRLADRAREELEQGTTEQAIELLDAAIKSAPNTAQIYVIRAHAFFIEGSNEQARADLERAVSLEPSPPWLAEAVAVSGELYEAKGDRDAAIASYRRAVQIFPPNQTARTGLARMASR